jgi:uncharacterized membrane protein required for colicin V production
MASNLLLTLFLAGIPAEKHIKPEQLMMIAAVTQSLTNAKLPINWFDATIVIVLVVGLFRGRKNGMTKEIIPTIQWVIVAVASGLAYPLVAQLLNKSCGLDKLWSAILGYLTIALVVFIIFGLVKKALMPRLTGSNIFGSAEYYAGMLSGMIRYTCIIIFVLALINAKSYSAAEILQKKAYNERWYGGGIYSGDYMPDLNTAQTSIFKESFSGPYIKSYLGVLLIQTGPDTGAGGAAPPPKKQPIIHIGN